MGKMTKNKGCESKDMPWPRLPSRRCTPKATANGVLVEECRYFGTEDPAALALNRPSAYLKYSGCLPEKGTEQNNDPILFLA